MDSANTLIARFERRLSTTATGVALSILLYAFALMSVTPTTSTFHVNERNTHAVGYARLSEDPFCRTSHLSGRILTPFIAHYLGLSGSRFVYIPIVMGCVLLSYVYVFFRRDGCTPVLAAGAAAAIALSTPTTSLIHLGGLPDTTSFVLIMVTYALARRSSFLWGIPLALAYLNHENALTHLPFFLVLVLGSFGKSKHDRLISSVCGLFVVLLTCCVWKYHLQGSGAYSIKGYFNSQQALYLLQNSRYLPLGIFMAFRLLWLIPWVALTRAALEAPWSALTLVTLFSAVCGQVLVASDISRLVGFGFLLVLHGLLLLRRWFSDRDLERFVWFLIAVNCLFIPQYHVWTTSATLSLPLVVSYPLWKYLGVGSLLFENYGLTMPIWM